MACQGAFKRCRVAGSLGRNNPTAIRDLLSRILMSFFKKKFGLEKDEKGINHNSVSGAKREIQVTLCSAGAVTCLSQMRQPDTQERWC